MIRRDKVFSICTIKDTSEKLPSKDNNFLVKQRNKIERYQQQKQLIFTHFCQVSGVDIKDNSI